MEEPWRNSIVELVKDAPLSPYLFIFMMNVLFFLDVRRKNNDPHFRKTVNNMSKDGQ